MYFSRLSLLLALLTGLFISSIAQFPASADTDSTSAQARMFPFALPPFDATNTATDVSWMNSTPAGGNGFIKAEGEHFVDGNGKPIRFWGVNLNFVGVFPPKEQAAGVAARLAKFGFNAVRIHHFDGNATPNGIWKALANGSSRLKMPREIDPVQLDRFDFFMAELLKRGIYINLNLHVGRKVYTEEGFARASALPDKDKGANYFDEKLIAAHKDFARTILKHVNPYTNRAYADEPGVCAVETTNENSLLGMWLDGSLAKIPEPYSRNLRDKWHDWLKTKYSTEEALRAAWTELDDPLDQTDLFAMPYPPSIINPSAPDARLDIGMSSLRRLKFKSDAGAAADIDVDPLGGPTINGFVRPGFSILLKSLGNEKWGFQLNRDGLDLQDNQPYTLTFWARTDAARRISVNLWQDRVPFDFLGFTGYADLTTDWQQYSFVFRPSDNDPNHVRLGFNLGSQTGTVQLGEIALQPGGKLSAPASWTLTGTPLIELRTTQLWNARRDFAQFLGQVESTYVADMRGFLKEEMGVKCPIWNTQAQFGGWGGVWRERESDAIDVHAYWKHPSFGADEWSTTNWKVENASMTPAAGIDPLSGFAYYRLKGKPFVMTEWNSGQPNDFGQESLLMIASYAAWQDWGGVYFFDYHSRGDYDRDYISGFFSIDSHPAKMATAPLAALIFRRPTQPATETPTSKVVVPPLIIGDVLNAQRETNLTIPPDTLWLDVARSAGQPTPALVLPTWQNGGAARGSSLRGKVYARFGDTPFAIADRAETDNKNVWLSDTNQIQWSRQPGVFSLNAPLSKVATGFLGGYQLTLDECRFTVPAQNGRYATLALTSLDSAPILQSKRMLLAATGKAENINMDWNSERNSVGSNWGRGPTIVEGVTANVQLLTDQTALKVYALSPTGARVAEVPSTLMRGRLLFSVSPHWKTLWYEIASE